MPSKKNQLRTWYHETRKQKLIQNTISGVSSSKDFYKSFVKNLGTKPETTQSKWGKDCNKEDLRWEKIYSKPFECSNSSKLRNFQFNLLHRRIATNSFLQKLGIKDTDLCTFSMKETETLTHLFWTCEETCKFWTSLEHWLHSEKTLSETKEINKLSAFGLNTEPESTFLGFCTLAARYYIYTCRLREIIPKTYSFTKQLKYYACIEREILRKKHFEEKWRSLFPFSFLDNPSVD